jgi:ferredoxin
MKAIRIRIDRDECIQCATCWQVCPEVFEEGPDDWMSQIVEEYRVDNDPALGEAPEELEDCIQEAVVNCPVQIIHVKES